MKIGIMQPYFVPYLGYWQLMNAVDRYVVYDDVNYIKGGWINRNRILMNGQPKYFNLPMLGASPNKLICEVGVNHDAGVIGKNLRIIEAAYQKAPYFMQVYPVVEQILTCGEDNLAAYLMHSFQIIGDYLGIQTELIMSSSLDKNCLLRGQDKVLAICGKLGATDYYNAIGGQKLYSFSAFQERGIQLSFLQTGDIAYEQFGDTFQSNLSILDVMMFNSKEHISNFLQEYTLITEGK